MTSIKDLSLEERRHEFILKDYEFWTLLWFVINEFSEDPYDDDLMECFNHYLENQAGLYIHPDNELEVMHKIDDTKKYIEETIDNWWDVHEEARWRIELCNIINGYTTAITFLNRTSETITYSELDRRIGWSILCNNMESRWWTTMEIVSWSLYDTDEFGREEKDPVSIFQYYIISDSWADYLKRCTDEIVFYDEELDIYVWWITHLGTSWDYVYVTISY